MITRDSIHAGICRLSRWQQVLFCASCVERATPIVRRLAKNDLVKLWGEWVALLWESALSRSKANLNVLLEQIEARPEASFDDSHYPEYYVMRAIGLLWYSASTIESEISNDCTASVSDGMASFASDMDFTIGEEQRRQLLGSGSNISDIEYSIQDIVLTMLSRHPIISKAISDELRQESQSFVRVVENLLPEYCRKHGWSIN